jgi:hypothetical protein
MWPFVVWCLVLLGPLKMHEGFTHLLVMVDKFTKWIEARPLAKISFKQVVSFVQDSVLCFGVSNSIINDNRTQFTGEKFLHFYDDKNIRVDWVVVAHPHTNGQVERANSMILQGLKPCILT